MDLGGDIGKAIFDLANILICKVFELLALGIEYLIKRYITGANRGGVLKKIERKDLKCRKTTIKDEVAGVFRYPKERYSHG